MTYEYDVFISYRRKDPVLPWVREHFAPQLEQWLSESLPHEPKLFRDEDSIETGSTWPLALREGLRRTRLLVAVFSPSYFRSPWCRAEFESMLRREQQLGLRTPARPDGLIYGVCFSDGEHFPEAARAIQSKDLRPWNQTAPAFPFTAAYVQFVNEMQTIAAEIAKLLPRAPEWRADWPILTPTEAPGVSTPLPRLA